MEYKELKKGVIRCCNTIPDFIDIKDEVHHYLFSLYQNIMFEQSKLITDKFLPTSKIMNIKSMVRKNIEMMELATLEKDLVDKLITLEIVYFSGFQDLALENEQYEIVSNIKNYFDLP